MNESDKLLTNSFLVLTDIESEKNLNFLIYLLESKKIWSHK